MHRRVAVLCLPGTVAFDATAAFQIFAPTAGSGAGRYDVTLCAPRRGALITPHGFALQVTRGLEALDAADLVVVPGTHPVTTSVAPRALRSLRTAHERGAQVASICTGAFVLAASGLLDGRPATTHWRYAARLRELHPSVDVRPDVLYVDDGDVLTSAGLAAGIDLCLHIVRTHQGVEIANAVARETVVAPYRAGGQTQFIERPLPPGGDGAIAAVRAWLVERLDQPPTVDAMAAHAYLSRRSFTRRFRQETGESPARWLLDQRLMRTRELLEATDAGVAVIAQQCGFASTEALRAHFVRSTGLSPARYRQTFRGS